MYCKKCGKINPDNVTYCQYCGTYLKDGSFESAVNNFTNKVNSFSEQIDRELNSAINNVKVEFNQGGNYNNRGKKQLTTNRNLLSYILLSIITCGIYGYWFIYNLSKEINIACEGDGERTADLATYIIFSFFTLGIYSLYWEYKIANRIAANGGRYGIQIVENGSSVLLWRIVGFLICFFGTYIGTNILITNANKICAAYNNKYNGNF